jgi:hypothetical protein
LDWTAKLLLRDIAVALDAVSNRAPGDATDKPSDRDACKRFVVLVTDDATDDGTGKRTAACAKLADSLGRGCFGDRGGNHGNSQ